jgi:hypothetical protein
MTTADTAPTPTGETVGHDDTATGAADIVGSGPAAQLRRLQAAIREQVADAVAAQALDLELANTMLANCGLPPLPARWRVRIGLVVTCAVTAGGEEDAYAAATEQVEEALLSGPVPIDVDWDNIERLLATCEGLDTAALQPAADRVVMGRRRRWGATT